MYVIQVYTNEEMTVKQKIEDLGFKAFVPRENRLIKKSGNWSKRIYVLFKGYVFIDFEYSKSNYYSIKSLDYVIRFLGDDSGILNPDEIRWIEYLANNDEALEPIEITEVLRGSLPFSKIKKIDKHKKRIIFELSICNESRDVEFSLNI